MRAERLCQRLTNQCHRLQVMQIAEDDGESIQACVQVGPHLLDHGVHVAYD